MEGRRNSFRTSRGGLLLADSIGTPSMRTMATAQNEEQEEAMARMKLSLMINSSFAGSSQVSRRISQFLSPVAPFAPCARCPVAYAITHAATIIL